jgi:hypothetical protein
MLVGLALILVLRWRPQGILPERIPPAPPGAPLGARASRPPAVVDHAATAKN